MEESRDSQPGAPPHLRDIRKCVCRAWERPNILHGTGQSRSTNCHIQMPKVPLPRNTEDNLKGHVLARLERYGNFRKSVIQKSVRDRIGTNKSSQ